MEYRIHKMAALALAGLLMAAPQLRADGTDDMEELRSTLGDLSAQVNKIDAFIKDKVIFGGDFRYRYEKIDDFKEAPAYTGRRVDRERYRIRLRLKGEGKVNDFTTVKVQLATGGTTDATSTNQTLDGDQTDKAFVLDKAEVVFAPKMILSPVAEFGKMGVPFETVDGELIFDGDLTPEGVAAKLSQNLGAVSLTVIGAQYLITEVSGSTLDPKFEGGQVVLGTEILGFKTKVAGAYYNWINVAPDVDVVDALAQVDGSLFGLGLSAFYEWEKNTVTDVNDTAYIAGVSLASGKLIPLNKDWLKVSYNYRETKSASTYDPWNFSDFADGALDAQGHMVQGKIKLFDNTDMALTYFSNQIGMSKVAANTGVERLFERWQWDLAVKF